MPQRSRAWEKSRSMISIKVSNKKELEKIGTMRDTYDDVVEKLIKFWKQHHR